MSKYYYTITCDSSEYEIQQLTRRVFKTTGDFFFDEFFSCFDHTSKEYGSQVDIIMLDASRKAPDVEFTVDIDHDFDHEYIRVYYKRGRKEVVKGYIEYPPMPKTKAEKIVENKMYYKVKYDTPLSSRGTS